MDDDIKYVTVTGTTVCVHFLLPFDIARGAPGGAERQLGRMIEHCNGVAMVGHCVRRHRQRRP